jgi:prepilin peptidase CpaA
VLTHTAVNGLAGLGFALLGFATGFGILLVLWLIGGGGGGDVKLMGALGAWLGVSLTLGVFILSAVLAAVATAAVVLAGVLSRGFRRVQRRCLAAGSAGRPTPGDEEELTRQRQQRRVMPYAVPVALGTWIVLALAWMSSTLPW